MSPDEVTDAMKAAAMDSSPDAIMLFDGQGTIVYANDSVRPVFGWTPAELVGSNITDLLHPEDVASAVASMRSFRGEGAKARTPSTIRFRRADGTYGTVESNGNPVQVAGVVDGPRLNSIFGRRAEFARLVTEVLDELGDTPDVEAMLELLPDLVRWRVDVPYVTAVWDAPDGTRRRFGDDIPPELAGLVVADDPTAPHHLAWQGKELTGACADLPAELAPLAEALDLDVWWLRPIAGGDIVPSVLVSVWGHQRTHNEPAFDQRLRALTNLIEVSLAASRQHAQLVHDARHDALTGLVNRRTFLDALARGHDDEVPVAVVYIDLDDFKPVNDHWGHQAGDQLLAEVAARLAATCRVGDLVARLGGDEFAILCAACTEAEAVGIAERFITGLTTPIDVGTGSAVVGASAGVATGPAAAGERLARLADEALYRAKAAGGNRVEIADGEQRESAGRWNL